MRALIVGASGGLGAAFIAQLAGDQRFSQVVGWSRSAVPAAHGKVSTARIDLCDEATIEVAARSLGEVDLVIVATGLLHDGHLGLLIFEHHCLLIGRPLLQEQVQQVPL